jgi:hypothetical protein
VLGAAVTPPYLTFAPSEYFDPLLKEPTDLREPGESLLQHHSDWLRRAGVTHVLSFEQEIGTPVWQGVDPLMNPALARFQPLFLYELDRTRGRVAWESPAAGQAARVTENRPTRVAIDARSPVGGRLILTDLMYPGWNVTVDGAAAEPQLVEGVYRGVTVPAGMHTVVWSYQPRVVYWGLFVSAAAWICLAAVVFVSARRSRAAMLLQRGLWNG